MIVRIVSFKLNGLDDEQFRRRAEAIADDFNRWPGLTTKLWVHDPDTETYGGVYLFTDHAAADASRDTELFRGMRRNPAFRDLSVQEYEVIDHLTARTGGAALTSSP